MLTELRPHMPDKFIPDALPLSKLERICLDASKIMRALTPAKIRR
jgi:hypothetical protein